ncbi:baseplate wedge subunit [Pseudomonas phage Astolliot]|nr:baseplate wedge subunit [Pseudomonas phage Astolliot]
MSQSPSVDQIRIKNVAATYVLLEWDDLGGIFTYEIQKSANGGAYILADFSAEPSYFDTNATASTKYIYRVRAVSSDYSPSTWTYTEEFTTFATNSYVVVAQSSVNIYKNFIDRKLTYADNFINFNRDQIEGVLIREGYEFSNTHTNVADIDAYRLFEEESLKIYGDVSAACGDRKNLMPVIFNDTLFMFERLQPIVRYSTNKAQTWITHRGIPSRVGNPVGEQIGASSDTALYIIGYDGIYALTFNLDIRWSSIHDKFSSVDTYFAPGKPGDFIFTKLMDLPPGVGQGAIDAIGISDNYRTLYVAAYDTVYSLDLISMNLGPDGKRAWDAHTVRISGNGNARVKNLIGFGDHMYAYVSGETNLNTGLIVPSESEGIYRVELDLSAVNRVYGNTAHERYLLEPSISNLSRSSEYMTIDVHTEHYDVIPAPADIEPPTPGYDPSEVDPSRVDEAVRYEINPAIVTTNVRPYRQPLKSTDGDIWYAQEENYHYECQFLWYSGNRIWVNFKQKLCVIEKRRDFEHLFTNTSEVLDRGKYTFYADSFAIQGYPGYTVGMAFYRKETGDLIGFYNLGYRTRDRATFTWIPDRTVLTAVLASNAIDVIEPEPEPTNEFDVVPPLDPMVYQFLPSHFVQTEPLYVKFVEEYLQFLSTDNGSDYGQLYNLLRNHDINETAYLNMFQTDLSKRNVYINKSKWTELLKFSTNRAFDIYSIKGIKEAYTFLFKFLYNEDVTISTEGDSKYEFDIIIESSTLTSDLVGNRIKTPNQTGQADVVYYERYFDENGKAYWQVTLNNIIGEFVAGDTVVSDVDPNFSGVVYRGVVGKEKPLNNEDYLQRGPTYYAIAVKSGIQVSKYRDDVLRFVHPVGFGFIGIMMLTIFINSGISTTHKETIIDLLLTMKWSQGLPKLYPEEVPNLDANGEYQRDKYGNILYKPYPNGGQPFPLTPDYMTDNPTLVDGLNADQRRKNSFLFDSSNMRFVDTVKLVKGRLKDGLSQRKDS